MKKESYIDSDGQELTKTTWNDGEIWYRNKQKEFHRLDGPAYICPDGKEKYWLNGKQVSKREIDLLWLKKHVEK